MAKKACFFTFWLIVAPVLAQRERSKLEASVPPHKLEELVQSRRSAQQELHVTGIDALSAQVLGAFLEPDARVVVAKMEQVVADGDKYTVTLVVEKILRGAPPAKFSADGYWREEPWPLTRPRGAQRFRPLTGKRVLASISTLDDNTQNKSTVFIGILDLDNPGEAAFLPSAIAAAEIDIDAATSGLSVYESHLASENPVVHQLAMQRLLGTKNCSAELRCEQSVLSEIGRLIASPNSSHRMQAVRWLGVLSQKIQSCRVSPCGSPEFNQKAVRELLKLALQDKNVAVGDSAFEYLAALEFKQKGNAGFCEEIVPALRKVERYPFTGENHRIIGGRLNGESICVGPAQQ
jgi:hypothetical protein